MCNKKVPAFTAFISLVNELFDSRGPKKKDPKLYDVLKNFTG